MSAQPQGPTFSGVLKSAHPGGDHPKTVITDTSEATDKVEATDKATGVLRDTSS